MFYVYVDFEFWDCSNVYFCVSLYSREREREKGKVVSIIIYPATAFHGKSRDTASLVTSNLSLMVSVRKKVDYRKPRMISNALLFFSRRFEQISFFCPKNKWVLILCRTSSRHQALPLLPSPNSHHGGRRQRSGWGPWWVH